MKKLLIIGTAPDNILNDNISKLTKKYAKNEWCYFLFVTKDYKNELIDEYVKFSSKFISENDIFDFSNYDEIVVCQSSNIRLNYSNVYLFLKNNGVNKCKVIYKNNILNTFNVKKNLKKIYIKIANILKFYNKFGF